MIGIPLFSGFVSKWQLLLGSLVNRNFLAVIVLVGGSLLAAAYLLPVLRTAFFERSQDRTVKEVPYVQLVAMLFLAVVIIMVGTFPSLSCNWQNRPQVHFGSGGIAMSLPIILVAVLAPPLEPFGQLSSR